MMVEVKYMDGRRPESYLSLTEAYEALWVKFGLGIKLDGELVGPNALGMVLVTDEDDFILAVITPDKGW